jgi:hypothetical protein
MALNLPIVGTVHPNSAAGDLIRTLGVDATGIRSGPAQIADCLLQLTQSEFWIKQSAHFRDAFRYWPTKEPPTQLLKRKINQIAFTYPNCSDEGYTQHSCREPQSSLSKVK